MKINSLQAFYAIIVFGILTLCRKSNAKCSTCSDVSYAACTGLDSFIFCLDGKTMSNQTGKCPTGKICTDKQGICQPTGSGDPSCNPIACNVCSSTSTFGCVADNKYVYCDPSGKMTNMVGQCEDDEYCSVENFQSADKKICGKKCVTKPTCSNTEYTTVTPTTASYKDSCVGKVTADYYPDINDSTCKNFVRCEILDGVMTSFLRTCPSGYFDRVKQKCVDKKPVTCA